MLVSAKSYGVLVMKSGSQTPFITRIGLRWLIPDLVTTPFRVVGGYIIHQSVV